MSRMPVINKTSWINPGNRPEKETVARTRVTPSRLGSIGGKGVHTMVRGLDAVMKAPRPYKEVPVKVPLKVQPVAAEAGHVKPQPRTQCPHCPLSFQDANEAQSHMRLCARVQVAAVATVSGPGIEDLAKLWEGRRLVPVAVPTAAWKQPTVLKKHPPIKPVSRKPRALPPLPVRSMCPHCDAWFPSKHERGKHQSVCSRNHKRDYAYLRWCDDGGAVACDD